MPVYNAERFLKKSIESILEQSYGNFEFIIIDDGSTDKSFQIIESYNDCRIKAYRQDHRGVTITLNKCIALSEGNILVRQDADDFSSEDRFKLQLDYLEENPNVYLLGSSSYLIDDKDRIIKQIAFPHDNGTLQQVLLKFNPFIHGSVMIKKDILKAVGLYREQFLLDQSYDLWLRISEKSMISNLPQFLYYYRVWDKSVSNEKAALHDLFSNIARELAVARRNTGKDILTSDNNYLFYNIYGKSIVDKCFEMEKFRLLRE